MTEHGDPYIEWNEANDANEDGLAVMLAELDQDQDDDDDFIVRGEN